MALSMKRQYLVMLVVFLVPLLVLGLGLGAACVSHRPIEVGLVDGELQPCDSSSNCVCSEDPSSEAYVEPLAFEGDADTTFASLATHLQSRSSVTIVEARDDYMHVVFTTPFLKFADDVEFRLDRERRVIHVRSASRIGKSDLGTNRERIEELRAGWRPPAPAN